MENTNQQSFWQFSDDLRLQSSLANLSINDAVWGNSFTKRTTEERRNFDVRVGGDRNQNQNHFNLQPKVSDFNNFNNGFGVIGAQNSQNQKIFNGGFSNGGFQGTTLTQNQNQKNFNGGNGSFSNGIEGSVKNFNGGFEGLKNFNGGFNNGVLSKPNGFNKMNGYSKNKEGEVDIKAEKKKGNKNHNNNNNNKDVNKNSVDKRFKTLPATEALPRNEVVGGYIFVCNNDTMEENLQRQLFGLPPRYRDSVRAITPGLPLFLYNYSTHQLHGIFEAASFGGTNIDPTAWEDKKSIGESRFPAQVRVAIRKICTPLEEDSFRPILHHYDGPKFRLELNIPEALALLDIFTDDIKALDNKA